MQTTNIRDDNLRLVFSKGHEAWLDNERRYHQIWFIIAATGMALGLSGLALSLAALAPFMLLAPVWLALLVKAAFSLRQIRQWRREHRAFLLSYNRAVAI